MIQDIFPKKMYNHYDPKAEPDEESMVIVEGTGGIRAKIRKTDDTCEIIFPRLSEIGNTGKLTYLFSIDEEQYFFAENENTTVPRDFDFLGMNALRDMRPTPMYRL